MFSTVIVTFLCSTMLFIVVQGGHGCMWISGEEDPLVLHGTGWLAP